MSSSDLLVASIGCMSALLGVDGVVGTSIVSHGWADTLVIQGQGV